MAKLKLYKLRSGRVRKNLKKGGEKKKRWDGDVGLSATGKKQLSFQLRTKPEAFKKCPVDVVFSSPLTRAVLTANAAWGPHVGKLVIDPRLQEWRTAYGKSGVDLKSWAKGVDVPEGGVAPALDVSRLKKKQWWNPDEPEEQLATRVQSILGEIHTAKKKRVVGLAGHAGLFKEIAGNPKPHPKAWGGNPRGWPKNFKPYFGKTETYQVKDDETRKKEVRYKVVPSNPKNATVVLLRHAHSAAQAARRAAKRRAKKNARGGTRRVAMRKK